MVGALGERRFPPRHPNCTVARCGHVISRTGRSNASYEVLHRMNMIDVLKRYPEVATSVVQWK